MANNKNTLTQATALISAIALLNGETVAYSTDEIVAKLTDMHKTISNKSTSKVSKAELEKRTALADIVLATLAEIGKPATVSEIQRANTELQTYKGEIISGQRITSILSALVKDNKVVNIKDKKKSYFGIAQ